MASEKETRDAGEKQEEEDPSEVDDKAEDGTEVEAGNEDRENQSDANEEEDETKEELEEGKGDGEDKEDEGKQTEEEKAEEIEKTKGSRREEITESGELKSPRAPGSERPTRERKMVERFKVDETPRSSASKTLAIEKGPGTQLKDIPNVAFKLSKRKADENLQLLHTILYGKKAKVHTLKKNLGLFSGFIWAENEEKQKLKVKEKIDKCVKEKLLDFCDVLNISLNKASVKKEELVAKLLEFLESPHATTDALLADKEKGKKRKSKGLASKSPAIGKSTKKQKSDSESGKKRKSSAEEEGNDKALPSHTEDNQNDDDNTVPEAESEQEENDLEDKTDEDEDEHKKQKVVEKGSSKKSAKKDNTGKSGIKSKSASKGSPVKASKSSGKSTKKSSGSVAKKGAEAESKHKMKAPLTKKQKVDKENEKDTKGTSSSKKKLKPSTKVLEKDQDDGASSEDDKKEPTNEEMHAAVVDILKEVDFNTATLSDILKQLGNHFGLDLIHRKSEVKDIITEVIKNMSDDDDGSGDESGKDEDDKA